VCIKLVLDDLLKRMPAGLMQMVGDVGWQLSHGERTRVYMPRALLQKPDLLILDEGLGAIDPLTREQCLKTLLDEAGAVILIAHL
jgi:ATP-binding cassette, subfamily B, bacterial